MKMVLFSVYLCECMNRCLCTCACGFECRSMNVCCTCVCCGQLICNVHTFQTIFSFSYFSAVIFAAS